MSTPRVAFVTDAGGEAGLGHFKRCAALARALAARGVAAEALVCSPADIALASLAPDLDVRRVDWWGAPRRVIDALVGRAPGAIIVDSYHAEGRLLTALRREAPVVAIDDLADRALPVDAVVNGAWLAERLDYQLPAGAIRLAGVRYALLDPAFGAALPPRPRAPVARVLVTLGGATPASHVAAAASTVRAALPDVALDVVVGVAAPDLPPLDGVTVHRAVPSLRPLLLAADLAVTAAGMTLYECLATATPTVALCVADNQRPNFEQLGAAGLVVPAELQTLGRTVAAVAADHAWRERLASGGRGAVDGLGVQRVADAILHVMARGVPARSA
jgi:spore coat polysaccharide biosynthesis predicted glycosyltransferase SpsG